MRLALPLCFVALAGAACAQTFPKIPANDVVYDGAGILSPSGEASIVEAARRFRENMGAPFRVATFPTLGKKTEGAKKAAALLKAWGMGQEGLLLVASKRERTAHVEVGEDWRRVFGGPVGEVLAAEIVPAMARRGYATALVTGAADLALLGESRKVDEAAPGGPPAAAFLPQPTRDVAPGPSPDPSRSLWLLAGSLTVVAGGAVAWRRWRKTA